MEEPSKPQNPPDSNKTIAVIGGGLAGSLTALMLIRQGFHVKLIEKNKELFEGASHVAARLHRGLEYPKDLQSAIDCMYSAIMWKLIMPEGITTAAPPMRALIDKRSDELGKELEERRKCGEQIDPADEADALTVDQALENYKLVRDAYEKIFKKVIELTGWSREDAANRMLGLPENFYRELEPHEYADVKNVAGGFQSAEEGLNIPKYLGMMRYALQQEKDKGNLEIITNFKVTPDKLPDGTKPEHSGIRGHFGNFKIYGKEQIRDTAGNIIKEVDAKEPIEAAQIVQAAHSGGPAITPELGTENGYERKMRVYRRAIMMVDLPKGWNHKPFFKFVGKFGMMVAPFNDKKALVYILKDKIPYIRDRDLTKESPELPSNWEQMSDEEIKGLARGFLAKAREEYEPLEEASNPKMLVADTVSYQAHVYQREDDKGNEVKQSDSSAPTMSSSQRNVHVVQGMSMSQNIEPQQSLEHTIELAGAPIETIEKGRFVLTATKLTHIPHQAFRLANMVELRKGIPYATDLGIVNPVEVLVKTKWTDFEGKNEKPMMDVFSFNKMEVPVQKYLDDFCKKHGFDEAMMDMSWEDRLGWKEKTGQAVKRSPNFRY